MRRITSIKNAIKYFSENTQRYERKNSNGETYFVYMPPASFRSLHITYPHFDDRGKLLAESTRIFKSFQWKNYVEILCRDMDKISRIVLYYE